MISLESFLFVEFCLPVEIILLLSGAVSQMFYKVTVFSKTVGLQCALTFLFCRNNTLI